MYFIDFFKNVIKRNNIGVLVWMLFNTIIVSAILTICFSEYLDGNMIISFFMGIGVYIIILMITLSSAGESIMRFQTGCKKIVRSDYSGSLYPAFNEVYEKAKKKNPELPSDIQLYMYEDNCPNAFAVGRRTICVSSGLMSYSERHIKAVLAHEFGHLVHKDTDVLLIIAVGNLLVNTIFVIYRLVVKVILLIFSFIMSFVSEDAAMAATTVIIRVFVDFLLSAFMRIWTTMGIVFCHYSSRKNENAADKYALDFGYGVALCEFLDSLGSSEAKGIWAILYSTHPDNNSRIVYLQSLGCAY